MSKQILSGIPIQSHQNCLVASIQADLDKEKMALFKKELLITIQNKSMLKGVIFDLSARDIIDLEEFDDLRKLFDIIKLMGYNSVVMGLKPNVIGSLIMMNADVDDIFGAINLDEAMLLLNA